METLPRRDIFEKSFYCTRISIFHLRQTVGCFVNWHSIWYEIFVTAKTVISVTKIYICIQHLTTQHINVILYNNKTILTIKIGATLNRCKQQPSECIWTHTQNKVYEENLSDIYQNLLWFTSCKPSWEKSTLS